MSFLKSSLRVIVCLMVLVVLVYFIIKTPPENKIDYKIELNKNGTVTIMDKLGHVTVLELDEVEEFLITDNE